MLISFLKLPAPQLETLRGAAASSWCPVGHVSLAPSTVFLVLAKVIGCQGHSSVWIQLANTTPGCSYLCFVYHVEETQNEQSLSLLSHRKQMSTEHHQDNVLYEICCIRTPGSCHQSCLHGFDKPALVKSDMPLTHQLLLGRVHRTR